MTDNTQTEQTTTTQLAPTTIVEALTQSLRQQIERANEIVRDVRAHSDNTSGKAIAELRKTSDDPNVVNGRTALEALDKQRETILAQLDAWIAANLLGSDAAKVYSPEEVTSHRDAHKVLRKQIKDGNEFVTTTLKGMGHTDPIELPELLSFPGSRGGNSGSGSGGRKPRLAGAKLDGEPFSKVVRNAKGESVESATFSLIALELQDRAVRDAESNKLSDDELKRVKAWKVTARELQEAALDTDGFGGDYDKFMAANSVEFIVGKPSPLTGNWTVEVFPRHDETDVEETEDSEDETEETEEAIAH